MKYENKDKIQELLSLHDILSHGVVYSYMKGIEGEEAKKITEDLLEEFAIINLDFKEKRDALTEKYREKIKKELEEL